MARLGLALATAGAIAASAAGAGASGGPSPGILTGSDGIVAPGGYVRYVSVSGAHDTVVEQIFIHSGQVLRWNSITGSYGIPVIAFDGQTGGLSRDGKWLVLSTYPGAASGTRLVVLDTATLNVRKRVTLRGVWSFDALSPDGRTIYLIQYLAGPSYSRYLVRAYDLTLGRLVKGVVADKTEHGSMKGSPVTRVTSADGTWAYTLYDRGTGAKPFIHALDTRDRTAMCIDLAWRGTEAELSRVQLTLSADHRQLVLRSPGDGRAIMAVSAPG